MRQNVWEVPQWLKSHNYCKVKKINRFKDTLLHLFDLSHSIRESSPTVQKLTITPIKTLRKPGQPLAQTSLNPLDALPSQPSPQQHYFAINALTDNSHPFSFSASFLCLALLSPSSDSAAKQLCARAALLRRASSRPSKDSSPRSRELASAWHNNPPRKEDKRPGEVRARAPLSRKTSCYCRTLTRKFRWFSGNPWRRSAANCALEWLFSSAARGGFFKRTLFRCRRERKKRRCCCCWVFLRGEVMRFSRLPSACVCMWS